jgi:glycerol kinase
MQFQADILQTKVERAGIEEISALGSALMAGLATGFWKDLNEIISLRSGDTIFEPEKSRSEVDILFTGWKKAIKKSRL